MAISKKTKIKVFLAIGIVVLWYFIRSTYVLDFARVHSPCNEPTQKTGDIIFYSRFVEIKRFKFVVFNEKENLWIQRVIGMPGDRVFIKKGEVFVNGKPEPRTYQTNHAHWIEKDFVESNPDIFNYNPNQVDENGNFMNYSGPRPVGNFQHPDTSIHPEAFLEANLNPSNIPHGKFKLIPIFKEGFMYGGTMELIKTQWEKPWTTNDFGPITVPDQCYFLLGDNRDNSNDSRYLGCFNKNQIIGGLLYP